MRCHSLSYQIPLDGTPEENLPHKKYTPKPASTLLSKPTFSRIKKPTAPFYSVDLHYNKLHSPIIRLKDPIACKKVTPAGVACGKALGDRPQMIEAVGMIIEKNIIAMDLESPVESISRVGEARV